MATGNPLGAGVVYPALEVFRHEPEWPLTPTDADRGDATRLRGFVEPCARDAELRYHFGGLEQSWLFASHTATDREQGKPANELTPASAQAYGLNLSGRSADRSGSSDRLLGYVRRD